jgi:hypothetical protein
VVELKLTEALVGDPETGEDAAAVPFPDEGPHGRGDRVTRTQVAALVPGRVAAEHGRSELEEWVCGAVRRPRTSPLARSVPR